MNELQPDDDRTIMPAQAGTSGTIVASTQKQSDSDSNALPAGALLGEFEILRVIGIGGFGIVYLANDHSLQRKIALKEYMPSSLAERSSQSQVTVRSERHAETFQAGMRSFINEARLLAQFDHPSLLKVYRFWEANGTAYMAMPFYEGLTLSQTLRGRTTPPDEAWLKALLAPLLDALETIHAEQCFHRDISPDNIMMLADDKPLLLDFGAARRAIGDMAQAFTVILKPGYAPIEQYADVATMQQGPWTDIYALASVVHFAITGRAPVPSVARMISDPLVPLSQTAVGRYSDTFLNAIDRALSVRPEERPQSIAELRSILGLQSAMQYRTASKSVQKEPQIPETIPKVVNVAPKKSLASVIAISVILVLVVAAGGVFLMTGDITPPLSPPSVQMESKLPTNAQTTVAPPIPDAPQPPVAVQIDPIKTLEQIFRFRNRDHAVSVSLDKPQVRIGKDRLQFSVGSSKPGYVYLLMVGTDRSQFWLLFPNSIDSNNSIAAGKRLALPRSNWRMDAAGPPGTDQFVVIVSESPRDFSDAGIRPNEPFAEFPLTATTQPGLDTNETIPVFAGKAKCSAGQKSSCSESFGAAMFSIEEIQGL